MEEQNKTVLTTLDEDDPEFEPKMEFREENWNSILSKYLLLSAEHDVEDVVNWDEMEAKAENIKEKSHKSCKWRKRNEHKKKRKSTVMNRSLSIVSLNSQSKDDFSNLSSLSEASHCRDYESETTSSTFSRDINDIIVVVETKLKSNLKNILRKRKKYENDAEEEKMFDHYSIKAALEITKLRRHMSEKEIIDYVIHCHATV